MDIFRKKTLFFESSSPRLRERQQLVFLKRLHQLLLDGYPLLSALQSLHWDQKMSEVVDVIVSKLKVGYFLDEAFDKAGFHEIIVSTLYFIRINGEVINNFEQSIQIFDQHILNKQKISQVIRYPFILTAIFFVLIYFIKTSILPSFIQFFQMNASDTESVFLFISIINIIVNGFFVLVLIIFVCYLSSLWLRRKLTTRQKVFLISKTPILKYFIKMKTTFYFANYFGTFLKVGMSFKDILNHMEQQKKLPVISFYALQLSQCLSQGYDISGKINELDLLDKQLVEIFYKNINHQSLEQDLRSFANILYDTFQQKLLRMITLIQPVFFVILACFIIFIYATLMWPMFEFIKSI